MAFLGSSWDGSEADTRLGLAWHIQVLARCTCSLPQYQSPPSFLAAAGVEVLAQYELTPEERAAQQRDSVIVAVRSDHLMATAFHPELTNDVRWALGLEQPPNGCLCAFLRAGSGVRRALGVSLRGPSCWSSALVAAPVSVGA